MPIEFNAIIGENSRYRSRVGTGLVGMTGNSGVWTGPAGAARPDVIQKYWLEHNVTPSVVLRPTKA